MSLRQTTGGYGLAADENEALWFNGGLGLLKADRRPNGGSFHRAGISAAQGIRLTIPHPRGVWFLTVIGSQNGRA
jgi:hypothetical protein